MTSFKEAKKRLRGSIAPIVTPFYTDGSIDFDSLSTLINWHIENGSHGISVTGTTGEPSSLSIEERVQVMEAASKTVNKRVPFVPGVSDIQK